VLSDEYIAGFLDADGYIALCKTGAGENWRRIAEVSFTNADKTILDKIQETYPGGRFGEKKPKKVTHNISYQLKYRGDAALKVMEAVLPFMQHTKKKERAELILTNYKKLTPRNGKYTEEMIEKKIAFAEEVMDIQMRGEGAY